MGKTNALLSTWYSIIATYVEFFFGFFISILVARQLAPEQYGIYGYLMWISSLAMTLANGGITLGIIKFIAEARSYSHSKASSKVSAQHILWLHQYFQSLLFKRVVVFIFLGFSLIFIINGQKLTAIQSNMLYIIVIASMIKAYHMYYVSVLKGFEDFKSLAILAILITPFNLILTLWCFFTKQALMSYVWVYLAVSIMYLVISLFLIKKNIPKVKLDTKKYKDTFANKLLKQPLTKSTIYKHIQTASWISILSFVVLRQSELFFLNIYASADVMAYFNIGFTIANAAMTLVPGVYSALLMPMMARLHQANNVEVESQLKLSLRYMFQLIIALLFPICFFAKEIFEFLYGKQYLKAVLPFQVIIGCVAFKTLSDCTNAYLWSKNKQSLMLNLIIIGSIVTVILDYVLIKSYQLSGALWAYSVSTILFVGLNLVLVMRKLETKLQWPIYFKTVISAAIALAVIIPVKYYLPGLTGVVVGSAINLVVYILMLLVTFSLNVSDILAFKKLNRRLFNSRYVDSFLTAMQKRYAQ